MVRYSELIKDCDENTKYVYLVKDFKIHEYPIVNKHNNDVTFIFPTTFDEVGSSSFKNSKLQGASIFLLKSEAKEYLNTIVKNAISYHIIKLEELNTIKNRLNEED